jgi:hypothetical protein
MQKILGLVLVFAASLSVAQDSTVVVFRRSDFTGSALKPSVLVDGNEAARLGNGRYLSLQVGAGKHTFGSSAKKEAPLEVDVKPNETLYLEMIIMTGWNRGGRLIPVGQDDAMSALARLKTQDGKPIALALAPTASPAQPEPPAGDNSQAQDAVVATPAMQPATVVVKSTPPGADITVDGKFMGSTPSTIQLTPGDHVVEVEKDGLRPWQRGMTITAGGNITIDATLDKP